MLEFIEKYKITYPITLDPDSDLADRFKLTAHPISVYIAPDGEILGSHIGGITEEQLRKDFERLFF